jgi:hypothetical protein
MKFRIHVLAALTALAAAPAWAADVGVSIAISQPGVYGRIDIGRFPQPQTVYRTPIIVMPPRVVVAPPQPVYMWVPPGHRRDWRHHCGAYNACGVPVVFVRDDWYDAHVRGRGPYPEEGRGRGHDRGRGHGNDRRH